jgi:hypothetical protein
MALQLVQALKSHCFELRRRKRAGRCLRRDGAFLGFTDKRIIHKQKHSVSQAPFAPRTRPATNHRRRSTLKASTKQNTIARITTSRSSSLSNTTST